MVIVVTYDNVRKGRRHKLPRELDIMDLKLPISILEEAMFVAVVSWEGLTTIKSRYSMDAHEAINELERREKRKMVTDTINGIIEQQITDLEEELDQAERKVAYLRSEIERKRLELKLHRQKIKDSGIKY